MTVVVVPVNYFLGVFLIRLLGSGVSTTHLGVNETEDSVIRERRDGNGVREVKRVLRLIPSSTTPSTISLPLRLSSFIVKSIFLRSLWKVSYLWSCVGVIRVVIRFTYPYYNPSVCSKRKSTSQIRSVYPNIRCLGSYTTYFNHHRL